MQATNSLDVYFRRLLFERTPPDRDHQSFVIVTSSTKQKAPPFPSAKNPISTLPPLTCTCSMLILTQEEFSLFISNVLAAFPFPAYITSVVKPILFFIIALNL